MPDLFPKASGLFQQAAAPENMGLPLYKEAAWNYVQNCPIWKNGNPVILSGAEAVKVWIYKALRTVRGRYEIYSRDFGCEAERLIGQKYSDSLKRAEAARYVREALEINPYITSVSVEKVEFTDGRLTVAATVDTIYGSNGNVVREEFHV